MMPQILSKVSRLAKVTHRVGKVECRSGIKSNVSFWNSTRTSSYKQWKAAFYHTSRIYLSEQKENKTEDSLSEKEIEEKIMSLKDQIELRQEEIEGLKQKLLQSFSQREQIRISAKAIMEKEKKAGIKLYAERLCDVVSLLDECIDNIPAEKAKEDDHLNIILEGLIGTRKQFIKAIKDFESEVIKEKYGNRFDEEQEE